MQHIGNSGVQPILQVLRLPKFKKISLKQAQMLYMGRSAMVTPSTTFIHDGALFCRANRVMPSPEKVPRG